MGCVLLACINHHPGFALGCMHSKANRAVHTLTVHQLTVNLKPPVPLSFGVSPAHEFHEKR